MPGPVVTAQGAAPIGERKGNPRKEVHEDGGVGGRTKGVLEKKRVVEVFFKSLSQVIKGRLNASHVTKLAIICAI